MSAVVMSKDEIIEACRAAPMSTVGLKKHHDELVESSQALADGYYITSDFELQLMSEPIEGPFIDKAYAVHRAVSVFGMPPPDDYNPGAGGSL